MEMTTPITTTSRGEMRFYLKLDGTLSSSAFPEPLSDKDAAEKKKKVTSMTIPASRLAVRCLTRQTIRRDSKQGAVKRR